MVHADTRTRATRVGHQARGVKWRRAERRSSLLGSVTAAVTSDIVVMATSKAASSTAEIAPDEPDDEACHELPWWSRTLCGYHQRFTEPFELKLSEIARRSTRTLSIEQRPRVSAAHAAESKASADGLCTGATVWDAGIVLASYVHARAGGADFLPIDWAGGARLRCLDLGSGTGIVGLAVAASCVFERVVLTDLPSVVPLLEANAAANSLSGVLACTVQCLPLRWEDESHLDAVAARGPYNLIVAGDVLYRPPVVAPLLNALRRLATPGVTDVLVAASLAHSPESMAAFRDACAPHFELHVVPAADQPEARRSPEVHIYRLRKRASQKKRRRERG